MCVVVGRRASEERRTREKEREEERTPPPAFFFPAGGDETLSPPLPPLSLSLSRARAKSRRAESSLPRKRERRNLSQCKPKPKTSPISFSNDLQLLELPLLPKQVLVLVEERDERGAKALVRRVDQLLARVLVPHDGDGLADQGDDVRAARQREAGGAPQEAQRGARFTGELARARKGQELGGAEVVDGHQVWIVILRDWKQKRSRGGEGKKKNAR